jgi:hypothetical protein
MAFRHPTDLNYQVLFEAASSWSETSTLLANESAGDDKPIILRRIHGGYPLLRLVSCNRILGFENRRTVYYQCRGS